jgi:DNA-binding NarL/FixJ family response regulator
VKVGLSGGSDDAGGDWVRLLIVDDQVHFRRGLRSALDSSGRTITVVGEAASGSEAIDRARELRPDVVLMDLRMPGGVDGITASRAIKAFVPGVRVLMLTISDRPEDIALASVAADGYLLKDRSLRDIADAVLAVQRGEAWPRVAV